MRSFPKTITFSAVPVSIVLAGAAEPEPLVLTLTPEEFERAREEAYREGFEFGTQSLNQQIIEQRSEVAHLQEQTLRRFAEQHKSLVDEVHRLLPDLAMDIARRVLAGIEPDRDLVRRICEEVLAEVATGSEDVEILLSPKDFQLVHDLAEEFLHKYPGIKFHADPDLHPGDCVAKSRFGVIDGRMSSKLHSLAGSMS